MFRFLLLVLMSVFACQVYAAEGVADPVAAFNNRFRVVKDESGKATYIKMSFRQSKFSVHEFIEHIKARLKEERQRLLGTEKSLWEAETNDALYQMGLDPYTRISESSEQAEALRTSLSQLKDVDVDALFAQFEHDGFWNTFEKKLQAALDQIDPTVIASLDDPRFFYKHKAVYEVVYWALEEALKIYPSTTLAAVSLLITSVHDQLVNARHYLQNMLLHYLSTVDEAKIGMTKEEVDRAVSSIYEYRIGLLNLPESNRAANDWLNYGQNKFYTSVRVGNNKIREWQGPTSRMKFVDIKKLNFGFVTVIEKVKEKEVKRIYHLQANMNMFSSRPALAYDYSRPKHVQRVRSLINVAAVVLGMSNLPSIIKDSGRTFLSSMCLDQFRLEGALIGYFESTGDHEMFQNIYAQKHNPFVVLK